MSAIERLSHSPDDDLPFVIRFPLAHGASCSLSQSSRGKLRQSTERTLSRSPSILSINYVPNVIRVALTTPVFVALLAVAGVHHTDAAEESASYVLLDGASGGQIISGGTDPQDSLILQSTSHSAPDQSTDFLNGAAIQLGKSKVPTAKYFSRGDLSIQGTFAPIVVTDDKTWTMTQGICKTPADSSFCFGKSWPSPCCTGPGTGACGYCDGTGLPIACDPVKGNADCRPSAIYMSQWYHRINFATDGVTLEGVAPFVFAPIITGSGTKGTRSTGATAFAHYAPTLEIPASGVNLNVPTVDGLFMYPNFIRLSGSQTGNASRVAGLVLTGAINSPGWTVGTWYGTLVQNPFRDAGSTIRNIVGHHVEDLTATTVGMNAAFSTAMSAAPNRYAIRSYGTAVSVHLGNVRIGGLEQPAQKLEVVGNTLLDNTGTAAELRFREPSDSGANYTALKAQAQSGDVTYLLPRALPTTDGQVLSSTRDGILSWKSGGRTEFFRADSILPDGKYCTSPAARRINRGPRKVVVSCASDTAAALEGDYLLPEDYAGGAVAFTLIAENENALPSGNYEFDFSCQCRGDSDTFDSAFGSAAPSTVRFTTQYGVEMGTAASVACDGSCQPGDLLSWRATFDVTASTTAQEVDTFVLGVQMNYRTDAIAE